LRLDARQYYAVAAATPDFALKMGALARERIGGLQKISEEPPKARVKILGHRWDNACSDLRRFLARNQITFDWVTPDASDLAAKWPGSRPADSDVRCCDWPTDRSSNGRRPVLRDCLVCRPAQRFLNTTRW
jgi:thioredoxin reductase (NADPH)